MENKALQAPSKNSLKQYKERKKEYLEITTNEEEKEFLNCFFLETIKNSTAKIISKIIDEITALRLFVGAIKDVDPTQIQFEADAIVKNYPFLTLDEIALAFKLFTQNKLIPLATILNYPNFSSLFISQIINSYIEYRMVLIAQLDERKKPQIEYKPSVAEKIADMRYLITEVHRLMNEDAYYVLMLNTVFNFFYRTKRIVPSQEELHRASRYADDKYLTKRATQNTLLADIASGNYKPKDRNHCVETFTREYCLKQYFESKPMEDILNDVNENDFNK